MKINKPKLSNLELYQKASILEEKIYSYSFEDCVLDCLEIEKFDGCTFTKVIFENFKDIEIIDCVFESCEFINGSLIGMILRNEFINCKLIGLEAIDLSLKDLLFKNCKLNYFNFSSSKLENIEFVNCNIGEIYLNNISLKALSFTKSTINAMELDHVDLKGLDISSSLVERFQLVDNKLQGLICSIDQSLDLLKYLGVVVK